MLNLKLLPILLALIYFGNCQENNYLIVQNISKFPIQIGTPFEITISAKGKSKLSTSVLDTMVIQVTDQTESDKEMAVYEFGMKEISDQDFNGEYFRIPIWGKNEEKRIIFSVINFTKLAQNQILEIYILNPTSTKEQKKMLRDLKLAKNIYKSQINLFIPSEIELKINSKIVNEISVSKDSVVDATCRAFNGFPKLKPIFVNYLSFNVLSNITNDDLNMAHIKFKVSLAEHGKNLSCQVGNETKIVKINVFHSPTKVLLQPEINGTVGNNTGIICSAFNGYPIPRIVWKYIEGPLNSMEYYQISPYNQRLFIKENAPIGSYWKFICSATNFILENSGEFNKTISFTVTNQKRNLTEFKYNFTYNNKGFDKEIYQNNLTKIDKINRKLDDLEMNINSVDLKISTLKDTSYTEKLQIFALKQMVNKLNDKQQETNEEIISIKKIVNLEIKNLKKEIIKLSENLLKKNGKIPEESNSIVQKPTIPIAMFDWNVYRIAFRRRYRKQLRSPKFENPKIRFGLMLFLEFVGKEYLRVTVFMSKINDADSSILIKGYVKITIMNKLNQVHQKSMLSYFHRQRHSANINFTFKIIDLYQNQILQSDDVIIRCSLFIL